MKELWHGLSTTLSRRPDIFNAFIRNTVDALIIKRGLATAAESEHARRIESQSIKIWNILNSADWNSRTQNFLKPFVKCLSTQLVARVLNRLNNLDLARSFLLWAGQQEGYEHDTYVYNAYLMKLGPCDQFDAMWELLDKMQREGCPITTSTLSIIVKYYGKAGMLEDCWKTLDIAPRFNCKPDAQLYTTLLAVLFDNCKVDKAKEVVSRIVSNGIDLDTRLYSTVIHGLVKNKRVKEAMSYFDFMLRKGFNPDVYICNSLISGFCETECPEDAILLYKSMQRLGCRPDVYTYNLLIALYCGLGKFGDVDHIFRKMESTGCKPNQVTYNTFLSGLLKAGKTVEADELFKKLQREGRVDDVSYRIFSVELRKAGDIDRLNDLAKRMYSRYGNVDTQVCNSILQRYCDDGNVNEAVTYFSEGLSRQTAPNEVSHALMINSLCKSGNIDAAKALLSRMEEARCKPTNYNYSPIIIELCKHSKESEAWQLFKEMLDKGIQTSHVTCDFLLRSLSAAGMADATMALCKHITDRGLAVNGTTIFSVVKCINNADKTDSAKDLIEQMQRRGCLPRSKRFKHALQVMLSGNTDEAEKFLQDPQGQEIPNTISYSLRIRGCCKQEDLDEAKRLLSEMGSTGCAVDASCYGPVISGLSKAGRLKESYHLYEEMVGKGIESSCISSNLMRRLCEGGMVDEILKLGEHIIAKGLTIQRSSVVSISEGFSKPERLQEVMSLYHRLRNSKCVKPPRSMESSCSEV